MFFDRLIRTLKEMLFPSKCAGCGSFFHASGNPVQNDNLCVEAYRDRIMKFEKVMAPYLCHECVCNFLPVESPICSVCGLVFESREGNDHLCGNCIEHPGHFGKARALGLYDMTLMEVIHSFKYKEKLHLARPLEELLFYVFLQNWNIDDIDLVVPVPLHLKRFRNRGFNQAYLLVRDWPEIARQYNAEKKQSKGFPPFQVQSDRVFKPEKVACGRPVHEPAKACGMNHQSVGFTIGRDALYRVVSTQPQTGLGRKERMENIKGAFSVNDSSKVEGKRVLLVDDVYTTGATADECAKAILGGGAVSIDVLTLARAA